MARPVVTVAHLGKRYRSTVAVDDVSLEVFEGEIFGLIGPNGAGKTTTMECVEGLRTPDRGTISVLGLDPWRDATALRQRIGVQHQEAHLQKRIKVWEAVDLWRTLYDRVVDTEALLVRLGLEAKRDARFMTLSGGQKQRLFVALALVHDPEVVFLDELTTGLDPQARRAIWELILGIKERGKTVFLTTHLMEEAERLCDRVAIIEHGRVIEMGKPSELVARHCPQRRVVFTSDDGVHTLDGEGDDFVTEVIHRIAREGLRVRGFRTETPTLEDVFLKLTGHGIRGLTTMPNGVMHGLLKGFWTLTWVETKVFVREPMGVIGSLGIPVVLFVVLGRMLGTGGPPAGAMDEPPFSVPVFSALFIAFGAVMSLVAIIAIYREGGILKRLRATPLSPLTILGAHVVVKLAFTVVSLLLLMVAGRRFFPGVMDVPLASFTAALLLSTLSILSLGFVIASLVPTARFAQPLGAAILYPMIAISGLFYPVAQMPRGLRWLANALPTTHAVALLQGVWDGAGWSAHWGDAGALVLSFVVCSAVAARVFRWE